MKNFSLFILGLLMVIVSKSQTKVSCWITNPDKSLFLSQQADLPYVKSTVANTPMIRLNSSQTYQSVDGFGFALTGGSAQHIIHMSKDARAALLHKLFSTEGDGVGISYLRLSIGASDLNDHVFSYDDLPEGETDVNLKKFSLSQDTIDVIPVLKEILSVNPNVKIFGSPWSGPTWMKTNHNIQGGSLKKEYYEVYARYFVKYIQEMKKHGITIDAVTLQNEPFNDGNTPSMQMLAKEQALFIKKYVGPLFKSNSIKTKIILYDHNCDAPEYPISILTDEEAYPYISGSGFHLYAGDISALTKVHNAFPDKALYFTEMMVTNRGGINVANPVDRILIGALKNWSRNVILWNLAADSNNKPHTDNGGCAMCQGAITIDDDNVQINSAYYVIAHASKFIPQGSVRIESSVIGSVSNVAFKTPDGAIVLIVANKSKNIQSFNVQNNNNVFEASLPAGSVITFVIK